MKGPTLIRNLILIACEKEVWLPSHAAPKPRKPTEPRLGISRVEATNTRNSIYNVRRQLRRKKTSEAITEGFIARIVRVGNVEGKEWAVYLHPSGALVETGRARRLITDDLILDAMRGAIGASSDDLETVQRKILDNLEGKESAPEEPDDVPQQQSPTSPYEDLK